MWKLVSVLKITDVKDIGLAIKNVEKLWAIPKQIYLIIQGLVLAL